MPVDDPPAREVVRRELDLDAVARQDPDPMAAHLPGRVAKRLVPVLELHPVFPVAQSLEDLALELDLLFLSGHTTPLTDSRTGKESAVAREPHSFWLVSKVAVRATSLLGMSIDPRVDIGHVHLKVSDIERALRFYRDVLGFDVMQQLGDQAAFISAGGYHHHLGLNTWESKGGSPPPSGTTGLYHVAIRYPDRKTLGEALRRVVEADIPLRGATDHGVSEAIYLQDPDGNGI